MKKDSRSIVVFLSLAMAMSFATACSSGLGYDDQPRGQFRSYEAPNANEQTGGYGNARGFKEGFQPSDLNPNVVTGRNELWNLDADAQIMAETATQVRGVSEARVHIIGGTAHVNVKIARGANEERIKAVVRERVQQKMPRYAIHVERLMGIIDRTEIGG